MTRTDWRNETFATPAKLLRENMGPTVVLRNQVVCNTPHFTGHGPHPPACMNSATGTTSRGLEVYDNRTIPFCRRSREGLDFLQNSIARRSNIPRSRDMVSAAVMHVEVCGACSVKCSR